MFTQGFAKTALSRDLSRKAANKAAEYVGRHRTEQWVRRALPGKFKNPQQGILSHGRQEIKRTKQMKRFATYALKKDPSLGETVFDQNALKRKARGDHS